MRLYEFIKSDPTVTKLVAVTSQLKTDLEKGRADPNMSLPEFLKYLSNYDIILDKTDLYNMIKVMPLKDLISNIQGDKIIFKGFDEPMSAPEDENKEVVANMAKHALKK